MKPGEAPFERVVRIDPALIAAGCATGYHARGLSGGFSETQLDENVFEVSFHGNGYTSHGREAQARDRAPSRARAAGMEVPGF